IRQHCLLCRFIHSLAYATGTNLEHLSALWGVSKQDGESDDRLRSRTQLALEGFSTAGPFGAYVYHSLAADSRVKDVAVSSPSAGQVLVSV
ncbi:baseplate J/gp47 family protein, partial [Marinomonas arenicola]|uniref:baseplate J/gp47 family protein n=1 Tax=Marinomonas arenicola TaxID=569601 RepID=UPI00311F4105